MKVEVRIPVSECSDLVAKGLRCVKYRSKSALLRAFRTEEPAKELADLPDEAGPIFVTTVRRRRVYITPSDVRVLARSEEEAREVAEELKRILGL